MALGNNKYWRYAAIGVAALLAVYVIWGAVTAWAPSRGDYEMQGVVVSEANGAPNWQMLDKTGVDFAYLTATVGDKKRDSQFQANLDAINQAGIREGALHIFDICRLASDQATLFNTTVPRTENALPAAVQLGFSDTCTGRPNRGLVLSEISTFLSQIEAHTGKQGILLITPEFEKAYQVSSAINRNVWLEGNWFLPDYSAKPWVMWTANSRYRINGIDGAVRWAVVRK